ncbi:RNA polymerase sigma factor [Gilvimarinus sp. SDUM040013]|uniref:RNA polymerase sigma factor n=1 Tax=Gilvimarinus gilvus TaxID=3058038 RepID=A0ABU4S2Y4_9GAMM|nr:RNA polymerase sigma factor [Gilvimarinus sp. SDUM040013]MDO3384801.1 RNA polymerase sigma factor [Gilvimarinus sp. SDUM040013]MDX6850866.1 RNA polymerase sigma factor [Gilvimarinus sp. SDUM040013]
MEFKYRTLVNQHQRHVYSLAKHMLADGAEAEDVCQDVYIRLWQNIDKVSEEAARPWLLRVTRNRCIDYIRKRQESSELPVTLECERADGRPAKALANAQLSQWLKACIGKLKEPYQTIVILADIEQLTGKEIAQQVPKTENQIKVYLHRGRKKLKAILQHGYSQQVDHE